jgi:K+-transporting ATPase ATPase B chain
VYAVGAAGRGEPLGLAVLAALFVCLAPTTIGGLLPAIGIAGIDRMVRANVCGDPISWLREGSYVKHYE